MPLIANVSPNGNAPQGLQTGDFVRTAGGIYQIVAPGTPGATFNSESGYWSQKSGLSIPEQIDEYNNLSVLQARENTAKSQEMSQNQMNFQTEANAKAMAFSAEQAEKNRQWQERMSSTAHEREVLDLVRAGLNPILSVNSGASTPSGASASGVSSSGASGQVDNSVNSTLGGILNSIISQMTAERVAGMNNATALQQTLLSTEASKYIAALGADASIKSAAMNSSAMKYSADKSYASSVYSADMNYLIHRDFPTSLWSLPGSIASHLSNVFESLLSPGSGLDLKNLSNELQGLTDLFTNLINYDQYFKD